MNIFLICIGVFQLVFSILISLFFIYLSFVIIHILTREIDDIKELKKNNIAYALYNVSIIFSADI